MASSKNMLDMENRHRCTEICNKMTVSLWVHVGPHGFMIADIEVPSVKVSMVLNGPTYDHEPVLLSQHNLSELVCDGQFME